MSLALDDPDLPAGRRGARVGSLPLPRYWVGSLAALISLIEVGVWITAAARFDFASPALQFEQQCSWFSDSNVSYHVGQYAFSLWLVGVTTVVMAACDRSTAGGSAASGRVRTSR